MSTMLWGESEIVLLQESKKAEGCSGLRAQLDLNTTVGPTVLPVEAPPQYPHWLTPSSGYNITPDCTLLVFLDAIPEHLHSEVLDQTVQCQTWAVIEQAVDSCQTTSCLKEIGTAQALLTPETPKVYHKVRYEYSDKKQEAGSGWRLWLQTPALGEDAATVDLAGVWTLGLRCTMRTLCTDHIVCRQSSMTRSPEVLEPRCSACSVSRVGDRGSLSQSWVGEERGCSWPASAPVQVVVVPIVSCLGIGERNVLLLCSNCEG
eukprot:659494-Rhodomonas_salina.2